MLVITRPDNVAESTETLLKNYGHQTLRMPISCAVPLSVPLADILSANGLIATSQQALSALEVIIDNDTLADLKKRPIVVIGQKTADYARIKGWQKIIYPEYAYHESVIPLLKTMPDYHFIYCAGQQRQIDFEMLLRQHSVSHKLLEVYKMQDNPEIVESFLSKWLVGQEKIQFLCFSRRFFTILHDYLIYHPCESVREFAQSACVWHIISHNMQCPAFKGDYRFYKSANLLYEEFTPQAGKRGRL